MIVHTGRCEDCPSLVEVSAGLYTEYVCGRFHQRLATSSGGIVRLLCCNGDESNRLDKQEGQDDSYFSIKNP